jgi:hypothetical protein
VILLTIPLAIVNASTLVSADEVNAATAALQVQVHRDFAPAWNVDADLAVVIPGDPPPSGAWWIVILDNSDAGGALGYHDLTSQGLPLGKVFVQTARNSGQNWTVLFSHEILEMLSDPFICLTALLPTVHGLFQYAYENCDACQSDDTGYKIGDQVVSDFCFPAWFDAGKFGAIGPFDHLRLMTNPFHLLTGGYAMCRNLSFGGPWTLVTGAGAPLAHSMPPKTAYNLRPKVGSRRERRRTDPTSWVKSDVPMGREFYAANLGRPRM